MIWVIPTIDGGCYCTIKDRLRVSATTRHAKRMVRDEHLRHLGQWLDRRKPAARTLTADEALRLEFPDADPRKLRKALEIVRQALAPKALPVAGCNQ